MFALNSEGMPDTSLAMPYVYKITHKESGDYYIGYRGKNATLKNPRSVDADFIEKYRGSTKTKPFNKMSADKVDEYEWEVLAVCVGGQLEFECTVQDKYVEEYSGDADTEARLYEREMILASWSLEDGVVNKAVWKCKNGHSNMIGGAGKNNGMYDKVNPCKYNPEWIANVKSANQALAQDPVWRANNKAAAKARSQDPEWKVVIKARTNNPVWRSNVKSANQAKAQDPEWRANNKAAAKARSQDPEWHKINNSCLLSFDSQSHTDMFSLRGIGVATVRQMAETAEVVYIAGFDAARESNKKRIKNWIEPFTTIVHVSYEEILKIKTA